MIVRVLFSILYAVVGTVLGLLELRGLGGEVRDVELLVVRREVAVLGGQIAGARFARKDRLVVAALSRRLPRPAWRTEIVGTATLLRWHGELAGHWTSRRVRAWAGGRPLRPSRVQTITPARAAELLPRTARNGRCRMRGFAEAMRRGEWIVTHQGIAFDVHGVLVDGQHRLAAIIEADRPVELTVFTDVGEGTFDVLDIVADMRASSRASGSTCWPIDRPQDQQALL